MKVQAINLSMGTNVLLPSLTELALTTREQWIDHDPVSRFETGDLISNFGNLTAELVAEYEGRNTLLTFSEKPMKVGATNPNRPYPHERLIRPDRRQRQVLKLKTSWSGVDEGFHDISPCCLGEFLLQNAF